MTNIFNFMDGLDGLAGGCGAIVAFFFGIVTFIEGAHRGENVRLKFTPLREVIEGRKVFLVDDTLVRGTTLKTVIQDLREKGRVREVHVRIGNPPVRGPCFYGIDMPTVGELFANKFLNGNSPPNGALPPETLEKMAREIGADSLVYLPVDNLIKALEIPKDDLCLACLDTRYPTPVLHPGGGGEERGHLRRGVEVDGDHRTRGEGD